MIIAIGCDHAGREIVEAVRRQLDESETELLDLCPPAHEDAVDYPDVAEPVAQAVAAGRADLGILVCGTGIGMSIVANKVEGIRAALCIDPYTARVSREHNDANILCLGGRITDPARAVQIVAEWLAASPDGDERHERRRSKVDRIERHRTAAR